MRSVPVRDAVKNHPHPHNQGLRLRCALVQLLLTIDNAHVTQLSPQRGLRVEHRRRCHALLADKIAYALTPEDLVHACGLRPTYCRLSRHSPRLFARCVSEQSVIRQPASLDYQRRSRFEGIKAIVE